MAVAWRQWRRNSNVSMGMRGWLIRAVGVEMEKREAQMNKRKTVKEENS